MQIKCYLKKMDKAPVFIKIDNYEEVLELFDMVSKKLDTAKHTLSKLREVRQEEDNKLDEWENYLKDVEDKLGNLNTKLAEPDQ